MGNCLERSRRGGGGGGVGEHCRGKKRAVWAEEKVVAVAAHREEDAEEEGETCKREGGPTPPAATDQVRIRITRKQLDELLRRVDDGAQDGGGDGGVPAREVISELLLRDDDARHYRPGARGQWRPALQSIPE